MMQSGLLLCVVVLALVASSTAQSCSQVSDGLVGDLDVLPLGSALGAHWSHPELPESDILNDELQVLKYEWAIVSEEQLLDLDVTCSSKAVFHGYPDIGAWEDVGRKNFGSRALLNLEENMRYRVVVRSVIGTGEVSYSVSNGFTAIVEPEVKTVHTRDVEVEERSIKKRLVAPAANTGAACPIDIANSKNTPRIGDYLTEVYGPPEWDTALNPFRETYRFTHFDDDDNIQEALDSSSSGAGFPVGAVIGIAFGVAGLVLLAMLLVALLTSFDRKSDKFKTNVRRHDNYEEF